MLLPMSITTKVEHEALELADILASMGYRREGWFGVESLESTVKTLERHFVDGGNKTLTFDVLVATPMVYKITTAVPAPGSTTMGYHEFVEASKYNEG